MDEQLFPINWTLTLQYPEEIEVGRPIVVRVRDFLWRMKGERGFYFGEDAPQFERLINLYVKNLLEAHILGKSLLVKADDYNEEQEAEFRCDYGRAASFFFIMEGEGYVSIQRIRDEDGDGFQLLVTPRNNELLEQLNELKAKSLNHSRPLDVHRWSDHREVNLFVDRIYEEHFRVQGGNTEIRKKQVKVLLLDLYLAWKSDPTLKIAVHRGNSAYRAQTRYNELHISRLTPQIVDRLEEVGLLCSVSGYFDPEKRRGRTSRIWPTRPLIEMFQEARFGPMVIRNHPDRECIILHDEAGKKIEYEDTDDTPVMRESLQRYNELIWNTFIDIPTLEEGFIRTGKGNPLYVNQNDKFTRRIFNRGRWDKLGRFFGGWWQRAPSEWRHQIFMNDHPVSEIDYSGLHIVMLYAAEGIDYWGQTEDDPYTLDDHIEIFDTPQQQRAACKSLMLVLINARDERSAFSAFRNQQPAGSALKTLKNRQLGTILDALREKHEPIAHRIASDAGIDLMYQDGQITQRIMDHFTQNEIPILTVHDSYLVPMGHERELEEQMQLAFEAVTGIGNVRLKEETHNPWDWEPLDEEHGVDHGAWQQALEGRFNPQRTERYLEMMRRFRE